MSVMNTLGNVALVGGAAVAGVALGGDNLADWMTSNAGEDPSKFWTGTAKFFDSAHDGITNLVPKSLEGHSELIAAATAGAVGVGLKFATSHASHDDAGPCRPNVPNLHGNENSRS